MVYQTKDLPEMPSKTFVNPMEHSALHQEKIQILSRLIKESTLTLEEALLLLQEEEQPAPVSIPSYMPGTTTPWSQPYFGTGTLPLSGTITVPNGTGVHFTNTTATTYSNPDTPQTLTADLNT